MSLVVLVAGCLLFAPVLLIVALVLGIEFVWAILTWPFRLLAWLWRACQVAVRWAVWRFQKFI